MTEASSPPRILRAAFRLRVSALEPPRAGESWAAAMGLSSGSGVDLVFDPMSGDRSGILIPQSGLPVLLTVAVVDVPGSIDRLSFRLVVVSADYAMTSMATSVYSSDSGVWINSMAKLILRFPIGFIHYPGTLVGNAIYWLNNRGWILQYDLERQRLAITYLPPHTEASYDFRFQIMPAEDGFFGVTVFDEPNIQFWERETDLHSAANWVLHRTIRLDTFLPLGPESYTWSIRIMGFDEESNRPFYGHMLASSWSTSSQ